VTEFEKESFQTVAQLLSDYAVKVTKHGTLKSMRNCPWTRPYLWGLSSPSEWRSAFPAPDWWFSTVASCGSSHPWREKQIVNPVESILTAAYQFLKFHQLYGRYKISPQWVRFQRTSVVSTIERKFYELGPVELASFFRVVVDVISCHYPSTPYPFHGCVWKACVCTLT